ncbi:MAG: KGGVGR-motif variant AAA ATPase [Acidimicrobiales bacterium]
MRTITFYSYKGGTGRTLLMANMAVLAAGLGRKVVALDFDLEAPGLPYKLFPGTPPRADGLVRWLLDTVGPGPSPSSLDDYLVDVPLAGGVRAGGWLKLMPAGRAPSPNYFQDLRRLQLDRRLDDYSALDALVDLQERLADDLEADYLLIDARTGITSTNKVTTHVLADEVVALTLDTPEQLDGTRSVLRSLVPMVSVRTEKPIDLHVAVSRVAPRPAGAGIYAATDGERSMQEGIVAFLTEPAQPVRNTIDLDRVHLLHTDLRLNRSETLFCAGPGDWTRSALQVDYQRVAAALFGPAVMDAAVEAMAAADPGRRIELGHFFASPEMVIDARGEQLSERPDPRSADVGLEDQVALLRASAGTDPTVVPDLAALLLRVSRQLRELGRREEAVAPAEEAVEHYRGLAATNPDRFESGLAGALNDLSVRLGAVGRWEEGLAASEAAVEVYQRLAATNPAAFEPDLAASLNNLSVRLGAAGRQEEGLATSEAVVEVFRRLASANPAAYEADLALALNNLSNGLGEAGRRWEGLAAIEEAVAVYRRLASANPAAHEPYLAVSLNNLSNRLGEAGRREESLAAIVEAVAVRRRLAAADPAAHEPDLARSLNSLSVHPGEMDRQEVGLTAGDEAVGMYRRPAAAGPAAYEPDLAMSLNNLSNRLGEAGRREESLAAIEEAVAVYRRLAAANPAAHLPDLAISLNNLSNRLAEAGRRYEGLAAIEEAVEVRRRLAAANPAAYEPDLATSLNNLSNRLGEAGRRDEGLAAITEAVEVRRRLAAANRAAFEPDLARSLNNLATRLGEVGRDDESAQARQEAEAIERRLLTSP